MRWSERICLAALLGAALVANACMIVRRYVGTEIQAGPAEWIVIGKTTRAELLGIFGPPDQILPHASGDVFLYRYEQQNTTLFLLGEPVVTNLEFFRWEKVQEKSNLLTVFFDREGVVSAFGYRRGRDELAPL